MSRRPRRQHAESIWAPVADTMTLAACVFLLVFLAAMVKYKAEEKKRIDAQRQNLAVAERKADENKVYREKVDKVRKARTQALQALKALEVSGVEYTEAGVLKLDEGLLFDRGSAELKPNGKRFVQEELATILARAFETDGHRILIAGHTDSVRMSRGSRFDTNWDLSSARATEVLTTVLDSRKDIPRNRLFAAGFAETQPLEGIDTEDGRNRRVEIHVRPDIEGILIESGL